MDKNTLISSFGKWISPINIQVFDRGYVDDERFDRMTDDGYFFVSRLKKNASIRKVTSFSLPDDDTVLSDKIVYIGTTQKRTENVFRLLEVMDTKGNLLRLITNRFDASAEEISDIYRSRWAIELFIKWMKQHVVMKHFYGRRNSCTESSIFSAHYLLLTCSYPTGGEKRKNLYFELLAG